MAIQENSIQKCQVRQEAVLKLLNKFHFVSGKHFESLINWHPEVCRRNLKNMVEKYGVIKRWRPHRATPYIYYLNRRTENMYHWLGIVTTFCYLRKHFHVQRFDPEVTFSMMQPDGYAVGKNIHTFIEVDRSNTNEFNKVPLYHRLFESDEWIDKYSIIIEETRKFPSIFVVTGRKKAVMEKISKENELGLNFVVMDINDIEKHME